MKRSKTSRLYVLIPKLRVRTAKKLQYDESNENDENEGSTTSEYDDIERILEYDDIKASEHSNMEETNMEGVTIFEENDNDEVERSRNTNEVCSSRNTNELHVL